MKAGLRMVDHLAAWTGALRWGAARASRGLTILMYHRILPEREAGGYPLRNLVITREAFERQVRWLARHARVVTLGEGVEMLARGVGAGGKPLVVCTFDDGYRDNAEHAAPVLEAHGVRGTFFVTSGFVLGRAFWFDRACQFYRDYRSGGLASPAVERVPKEVAPHLGSQDAWLGWLKSIPTTRREQVLSDVGASMAPAGCEAMSVQQVAALAQAGHEIGGHTSTHPVLTTEPAEVVAGELSESKRTIESWIGRPVTGFCYPNGSWNEDVRRACADAGYAYATTTRRHLNMATDDLLTLGRRWIAPDSTSGGGRHSGVCFAAEVLGLHDWIRDRMGRPRGPQGLPGRRTVRAGAVRTA